MKHAGCHRRTAIRAWEAGWPNAPEHLAFLRRPLKEVIAEEQEHTRAELQRARDQATALEAELEARRRAETRIAALQDVTEQRKQETQLVRLARGSTIQALATITNVAAGAAKIGAQVKAALDALSQQVDPATGAPRLLSAAECANAMRILTAVTTCLRQANDAGARAMEMERLLVGEPTSIVQHQHMIGPISMDEAAERIARAQAMLARAQARGIVLDGGPLQQTAPAAPKNGDGGVH